MTMVASCNYATVDLYIIISVCTIAFIAMKGRLNFCSSCYEKYIFFKKSLSLIIDLYAGEVNRIFVPEITRKKRSLWSLARNKEE